MTHIESVITGVDVIERKPNCFLCLETKDGRVLINEYGPAELYGKTNYKKDGIFRTHWGDFDATGRKDLVGKMIKCDARPNPKEAGLYYFTTNVVFDSADDEIKDTPNADTQVAQEIVPENIPASETQIPNEQVINEAFESAPIEGEVAATSEVPEVASEAPVEEKAPAKAKKTSGKAKKSGKKSKKSKK